MNTNSNKYQYTVKGVDYDVEIESVEGNIAKVTVNGKTFDVELKQPLKETPHRPVHIEAPRPVAAAPSAAPVQPKPAPVAPGRGTQVNAPLPGTITDVKVKEGDMVKIGDTVVVLEAMKMQNNIEAEKTGKIGAVLVKVGDTVMEGAPLVTIE